MNRLSELKERKKLDNKGFSLVELIIVIAIMAVLIGVLAPQYLKYVEKARRSADLDSWDSIVSAIEIYASDPANTASVTGTETVSFTAKGTAGTASGWLDTALKDSGITIGNVSMKSNVFGKSSVSVDATGTYINFTFTGDDETNDPLGKALGR